MCSQVGATLSPGTLLTPAGFTTELTLEMWELSSQETGGHLYRHNPKPKTLLQPNLAFRGNVSMLPSSLPLSEDFFPTDPLSFRKGRELSWMGYKLQGAEFWWPAYREELELERLLWRRRPGDRDRRRTGDLRLGERDLWEEEKIHQTLN